MIGQKYSLNILFIKQGIRVDFGGVQFSTIGKKEEK